MRGSVKGGVNHASHFDKSQELPFHLACCRGGGRPVVDRPNPLVYRARIGGYEHMPATGCVLGSSPQVVARPRLDTCHEVRVYVEKSDPQTGLVGATVREATSRVTGECQTADEGCQTCDDDRRRGSDDSERGGQEAGHGQHRGPKLRTAIRLHRSGNNGELGWDLLGAQYGRDDEWNAEGSKGPDPVGLVAEGKGKARVSRLARDGADRREVATGQFLACHPHLGHVLPFARKQA